MAEPTYLLDTNILSDLIKHPAGVVAQHIARVGESTVCTSIVVACELRYGCAKKGSAALSEKIEQLLSMMDVLPLEVDADREYGMIRGALEKIGTTIGANDMLIAAHALSQNLTLITGSLSEFSRINGLKLENWLKP
ncbi:MAG TPA: type II toxin-antitoxin system VapC family toxin [Gallionella sp.]|nr:type II toxin-antitoxin system VapC family toxin [Gallionella sp.]